MDYTLRPDPNRDTKHEQEDCISFHECSYDEIKKNLEGFICINEPDWVNIPIGTYVKYITKDRKFCNGSYIKRICALAKSIDAIGEPSKPSPYFLLEAKRFGGSTSSINNCVSVVYFEHIALLYKQINLSSLIEFTQIRIKFEKINDKLREFAHQMREFEQRLKALEKTNSRIVR